MLILLNEFSLKYSINSFNFSQVLGQNTHSTEWRFTIKFTPFFYDIDNVSYEVE